MRAATQTYPSKADADGGAYRGKVTTLPLRGSGAGQRRIERRWEALGAGPEACGELLDPAAVRNAERYAANIERYIGTAKIPIGIAGPLRVQGRAARGDFTIPLATTEAALVASYHRGARAITAAGGCRSMIAAEALSRVPAFSFASLHEVARFLDWIEGARGRLAEAAAATTRHGRLTALQPIVEGNHVYLVCEFTTGDAAGQNMVTFATEALVRCILRESPVTPRGYVLESNLSGDKKAGARSLAGVRGRQ